MPSSDCFANSCEWVMTLCGLPAIWKWFMADLDVPWVQLRQTPQDVVRPGNMQSLLFGLWFSLDRLLQKRVAPIFVAKNYEFHIEYVKSVRNWKESLPPVASLSGCFRKRHKRDDLVVPYSFTFIQRRRFLPQLLSLINFHSSCIFFFNLCFSLQGCHQTFLYVFVY